MPPLPPVADVIKVTQSWICGNNVKAESIFHFQYSGGPPLAADCSALAADIQAASVTELAPLMNADYKVGLVTVLDIASNTGAQGFGGSVTAGTNAGSPLAANTAIVVNHAIARRYRGGKPRTYIPPGSISEISTVGQWSSTFQTLVNTNFASWKTTCLAATHGGVSLTAFGTVSYFTGGAPRTTPVFEPSSQSLCRLQVGSQRRRTKGA